MRSCLWERPHWKLIHASLDTAQGKQRLMVCLIGPAAQKLRGTANMLKNSDPLTCIPDLVESRMKPSDPVKELRRILFEMGQFRHKIYKIRISTFWMSGKITDSRWWPTQQLSLVGSNPCLTHPHLITIFRPQKIRKYIIVTKCWFQPLLVLVTQNPSTGTSSTGKAVIKFAASAASLEGFLSRDQVGC